MEQKINVAELLKDCPSGMELDCTICDNLYFDEVTPYMIRCYIKNAAAYNSICFHHDGSYLTCDKAKCVIFPKGKTTWEGFQRHFKDGDIVATISGLWIGITLGGKVGEFIPTYCVIDSTNMFIAYLDKKEKWAFNRLATEEEKAKLFQAIKDNGYKWNAETKTLKKIKKEYPKTYEECCKVLGYSGNYDITLTTDVDNKLFNALYKLKVCRDAYWKIAGEEMGLGKSWKPDLLNDNQDKFVLANWDDSIEKHDYRTNRNYILTFPTAEMRDAFYENFNELIEQCKELL